MIRTGLMIVVLKRPLKVAAEGEGAMSDASGSGQRAPTDPCRRG